MIFNISYFYFYMFSNLPARPKNKFNFGFAKNNIAVLNDYFKYVVFVESKIYPQFFKNINIYFKRENLL